MENKNTYRTYKKAIPKAEKKAEYKPKRGKLTPLMSEEVLVVHGS